jgi:carboxymethylenebutenolidase
MDQRIIDLYDRYTHGDIDRRRFLERLSAIVGSATAAAALVPLLGNDYARAAIVDPADPRIVTGRASYAVDGATVSGLLAYPAGGADKRPAVIVVHENRGLNPHIEDVARRVAVDGFLAFAVDMLSPDGGTPADEDAARTAIGALDPATTLARLAGAVPFLASHPRSTGAVGAIGFCWGGGMVNRLATVSPELAAAVVYYGSQPSTADVARIKAAVLLHYAQLDERINAGIAGYEAALKADGVTYEIFVYPGVNHAFNNDTNAARYDRAAADLAWARSMTFLRQHLGETDPA